MSKILVDNQRKRSVMEQSDTFAASSCVSNNEITKKVAKCVDLKSNESVS